ncbi:MAG: hypothetical protein IIC84_05170 [Chloroflexi bacterium]|nr:hypothetical protein [Chloroflexota bacterium]
MTNPQISKEALKAMAEMSGLNFSDETLEELLPQIQQAAEALSGLDALNLGEVEPAITFKTEGE